MALRSFASSVLPRVGFRLQPLAYEFAQSLERTFATVAPDVKYAASHEWAKVEGDVATVGISDFAQAELGDIVFVELPDVGATIGKGETFGAIESVKAASDVYAPVSGEVTEVNSALANEPGKVNEAPFAEGWLIKLKLSNPAEADELLSPADYEKTCGSH